jgi:hypothetical protein
MVVVVPREPRTGWYAISTGGGEVGRVWVQGPLSPDGFWHVAVQFVLHRDEFVIAELRLFPGGKVQNVKYRGGKPVDHKPEIGTWSGDPDLLDGMPTPGITKRLLDSVSFSKLLAEARDRVAEVYADHQDHIGMTQLHEATKRRRRRPDEDYLVWAERYDAVVQRGTRSPIADLAKRHRRTQASVRDLVHQARGRGLLSRGHGTQAGGRLTPKARDLRKRLDEQERKRRRKRHGTR